MSRDVPFYEDKICDDCGATGGYDFMGDVLCPSCASKALSPDVTEMAFHLFWGWVNHPDEKVARAAWEGCDPMSRGAWGRAASRGLAYVAPFNAD